MAEFLETAEELMERRKRSARRQKLFEILNLILEGKIDSSETPLAPIFNQQGPRQVYISPRDRSSYNYGYCDMEQLPQPNTFSKDL
jgi:hypothetical protein